MAIREQQTTKHIFFCDICNEEIYDSYDYSASELMKRCGVCNKDICPDCQSYPTLIHNDYNEYCLCKNCSSVNTDLLNQIKHNHDQYIIAHQKVEQEYSHKECELKKQLEAKE